MALFVLASTLICDSTIQPISWYYFHLLHRLLTCATVCCTEFDGNKGLFYSKKKNGGLSKLTGCVISKGCNFRQGWHTVHTCKLHLFHSFVQPFESGFLLKMGLRQKTLKLPLKVVSTICNRKPFLSATLFEKGRYKKINTAICTCVYISSVQNGILSMLVRWSTLTGHHFGQGCRRRLFKMLLFVW